MFKISIYKCCFQRSIEKSLKINKCNKLSTKKLCNFHQKIYKEEYKKINITNLNSRLLDKMEPISFVDFVKIIKNKILLIEILKNKFNNYIELELESSLLYYIISNSSLEEKYLKLNKLDSNSNIQLDKNINSWIKI